MSNAANMVEVAALIGDTARAMMLAALMEGRRLTGVELAGIAGISKSTASGHLARLAAAGLVSVTRRGRFAYYAIGSARVAAMLESIGVVAALDVPPRYVPRAVRKLGLEDVRLCYDHLAGRVAVALADAMTERGLIELDDDGGVLTAAGAARLAELGVALPQERRGLPACRPCLDWSERRFHIGGRLGTAIACRCFDLGWIRRPQPNRKVVVTPAGQAGLRDWFGFDAAGLTEIAA